MNEMQYCLGYVCDLNTCFFFPSAEQLKGALQFGNKDSLCTMKKYGSRTHTHSMLLLLNCCLF